MSNYIPSLSPPHCPHSVDWLNSSTERDTPQRLSAFFLNQISHHCQNQVSDHQIQLFFYPQNPVRPEYFLPLCIPFPLVVVVVGSLLAHIKVNGPQQHTVSQHGEPVLAFKWPVGGPELFLQQTDVVDIHL